MMTKTIDIKGYYINSNHKMEEVVQSIYCPDFILALGMQSLTQV